MTAPAGEWLLLLPALDTPVGRMPAALFWTRSETEARIALADGALDVSEDPDAWRELDSELSASA